MKWVFFFWAMPLIVLGGWYGLSYYDINFGYAILSRPMHDLVFQIYGNILGMPPEDIPPLVVRAVAVDTLLLLMIVCFRRRKKIAAWWRARQSGAPDNSAREIEESLSRAP